MKYSPPTKKSRGRKTEGHEREADELSESERMGLRLGGANRQDGPMWLLRSSAASFTSAQRPVLSTTAEKMGASHEGSTLRGTAGATGDRRSHFGRLRARF